MTKKREVLRRPAAEYLLIAVMVGLFVFGTWAWRSGSMTKESAQTTQQTLEAGTPEQIDSLTEQDIKAEEAADTNQDDAEASSNSALDGAADNVGGIFDETSY